MHRSIARREFAIGIWVCVLAAVYAIITPFQASGYVEGNSISGRALPFAIALLLAVLGALHAYTNWKRLQRLPTDAVLKNPGNTLFVKRVVLYLMAACAYVAGIEYIGFIVSSFIILPCFITLSGGTERKALIATTLAAPLVLYFIFTVVMEIYLPDGLLL